jgi:ElaB/YqjD/DUF883 family membrane-anchored ribosome-binding protein
MAKTKEPKQIKAEIENSMPDIFDTYYKCKCGHEDFLQTGETKCSCGKCIGIVELTTCNHCQSQFYATDGVKTCPYCKKDLKTIEEKLEDLAITPVTNEAKAKKIKETLTQQKADMQEHVKDLENILKLYGQGNEDETKKARESINDIIVKRYANAVRKNSQKDSNSINGTKNNIFAFHDFLDSLKKEIETKESDIKILEGKIKNTQIPLGL